MTASIRLRRSSRVVKYVSLISVSHVKVFQIADLLLLALLAFWNGEDTFCLVFGASITDRFLIPFALDLHGCELAMNMLECEKIYLHPFA